MNPWFVEFSVKHQINRLAGWFNYTGKSRRFPGSQLAAHAKAGFTRNCYNTPENAAPGFIPGMNRKEHRYSYPITNYKEGSEMSSSELSASALKVQQTLVALGVECKVVELPGSTRSAKEAAQAIGCTVEQIVKSLVFRAVSTGRGVLVMASGANRVNETLLGALFGEPIEKADADFVREQTGFAIGGVPPVGHARPMVTFIDAELLKYAEIWAAAGTPHAVFRLTPDDLIRITGGQVTAIS
jgi:prolyl-tRNA editing enzyme YbaK/EbsC (Cys-tRNA(Pro) deacylase)